VQFAEGGNLVKRQSGIVDKPDGRCLWHEKLGGH